LIAPYRTSDPDSFAHTSACERWPIILTQGIDDVHRTTWESKDTEVVREGKWLVSELAKLKYELQHDRELTPLPDDGESDVAGYNEELKALGRPTWINVPWLFAECYLYRYEYVDRGSGKRSANCPSQTRRKHLLANRTLENLRHLLPAKDEHIPVLTPCRP
jgi:hypothetical protein